MNWVQTNCSAVFVTLYPGCSSTPILLLLSAVQGSSKEKLARLWSVSLLPFKTQLAAMELTSILSILCYCSFEKPSSFPRSSWFSDDITFSFNTTGSQLLTMRPAETPALRGFWITKLWELPSFHSGGCMPTMVHNSCSRNLSTHLPRATLQIPTTVASDPLPSVHLWLPGTGITGCESN